METNLAVPLSMSQIDAAQELYKMLLQWQQKNRILLALKEQFPDTLDPDGALLKVVVLNQFYYTNVMAVDRMTMWILEIMSKVAQIVTEVEIVEQIAALPMTTEQKGPRNHYSFASKFAHFFIDMERFPIYDSYAVKMVAYHLSSQGLVRDTEHPYKAFVANLNQLKQYAGLVCTTRELDHYLWLAGMYRKWRAQPGVHIGFEVSSLFSSQSPEVATNLNMLCEV